MKDIVIKGKTVRRGLEMLLVCFIAAVGVNVYSIIKYHTPFYEVFTQIGYTILLTLAILAVALMVKLVVFLFRRVFAGKDN